MQPIPLVDLPQDITWIYLFVAAVVSLVVCIILMVSGYRRSDAKGKLLLVLAWISVVVGLVLTVIGMSVTPNTLDELSAKLGAQTASAQAEIEKVYGLELTESEVEALKYPTEAPEKDFNVYGSILQREQIEGAQFVERTIYLVWADGELQLSESEDGKSFDELEAAK